jgi:hypothetical protein
MRKISQVWILSFFAGSVLLVFQLISSLTETESKDWEYRGLIDIIDEKYLLSLLSISWLGIGNIFEYVFTISLFVLLFCIGVIFLCGTWFLGANNKTNSRARQASREINRTLGRRFWHALLSKSINARKRNLKNQKGLADLFERFSLIIIWPWKQVFSILFAVGTPLIHRVQTQKVRDPFCFPYRHSAGRLLFEKTPGWSLKYP